MTYCGASMRLRGMGCSCVMCVCICGGVAVQKWKGGEEEIVSYVVGELKRQISRLQVYKVCVCIVLAERQPCCRCAPGPLQAPAARMTSRVHLLTCVRVIWQEARDIMTYPVLTCTKDMTMLQVANLLRKYGIHGMPVVGVDGGEADLVLGLVTHMEVRTHAGPYAARLTSPACPVALVYCSADQSCLSLGVCVRRAACVCLCGMAGAQGSQGGEAGEPGGGVAPEEVRDGAGGHAAGRCQGHHAEVRWEGCAR
jgi:hypothetical protein